MLELDSSTIPHLLTPPGNDPYGLIRQCYVDGMMYGEAVSWPEDGASKFILVQECYREKTNLADVEGHATIKILNKTRRAVEDGGLVGRACAHTGRCSQSFDNFGYTYYIRTDATQ